MKNEIKKSERGGKTAYLKMGAWYDDRNGHIHLAIPGTDWFHTTVAPNTESKRGHPNLYGKLARALRDAGVPAPDASDTE